MIPFKRVKRSNYFLEQATRGKLKPVGLAALSGSSATCPFDFASKSPINTKNHK
jgi:hypothetical protein